MPSSATGVGMPICLLGGVLLILTQKNSQKFGDVLGISTPIVMSCYVNTVSQRVLLIKFKVVNCIFYSFYQNNAIGFNCLRSCFHCSTK